MHIPDFIHFNEIRDRSENITGGGGFLIFAEEIWGHAPPRIGRICVPFPRIIKKKHPYMHPISLFELFQLF